MSNGHLDLLAVVVVFCEIYNFILFFIGIKIVFLFFYFPVLSEVVYVVVVAVAIAVRRTINI